MIFSDVLIIGAGPAGIFSAYELSKNSAKHIVVLDKGLPLDKRKCPIDGIKIKSCVHCKSCSIMNGFGGAGGFSDGKYNITNAFGGDLYNYVGEDEAINLMNYVDKINMEMNERAGCGPCKLYSTEDDTTGLKAKALKHDLHLLDAKVRHLGTDRNKLILEELYKELLANNVEFHFLANVFNIEKSNDTFYIYEENSKEPTYSAKQVIIATGRSGSKWTSDFCKSFGLESTSNRVDIGVRVEVPEVVFHDITESTYEAKICYRTKEYKDLVRTFCMNPKGVVVEENTNGIVTVNGHSYSNEKYLTKNTNFALLVTNNFSEPFNDSNAYGEHIARLANMLGGGVLVQRFGDLTTGRRTTEHRLSQSFTKPTLKACPGDLSLVLPKRQLDDIIEMIYALDKIAPGMANDDTLLYGVEVKFYNSTVKVDNNFETSTKDLFIIGDCGGSSHSLSVAAAEGVHVARFICS